MSSETLPDDNDKKLQKAWDPDEASSCSNKTEQPKKQCEIKIEIDVEEDMDLPPWKETCIYRVPKRLRDINSAAYTPQLVSIGPLHRNLHADPKSEKLARTMEQHKPIYLINFLDKAQEKKVFKSINDGKSYFLNIIKDFIREIRQSYNEKIELCDDDLADMVLLDSAFIIMHIRGEDPDKSEDFIDNPQMRCAVQQDLMLLENQLPYFILEVLYEKAFLSNDFYDHMVEYFEDYTENPNSRSRTRKLGCDYCFSLLYCYGCCAPNVEIQTAGKYQQGNECCSFKHLTDYVWTARSQCESGPAPYGKTRRISATNLHKAGVLFMVEPEEKNSLGITFEHGKLIMPVFEVDDSTECLLRNLMAYEQLHLPGHAFICNYVSFMNDLIDTVEDVELLVENGVVEHMLGDNQAVADLINSLDKQIVETSNRYKAIHDALEEHCNKRWFSWLANLRQVYFKNTWQGTGTVVALFFLILTFINSYNSFRQIL